MTKHSLQYSHLAFSLLLGAASMSATATPAQNPTAIQVSYGGSVYNLTSKITSYNADSALLQSQPWWGNSSLAYGLAAQTQYQLGDSSSYGGTSGLSAGLAYTEFAGDTHEIVYLSGNTLQTVWIGSHNWNFVILSQPLITLNDLSASLASTSQGIDAARTSSELLINGAHSRPLSRSVAPGKKTVWMLGDWGRDDHGSRDGSVGLAELGGGYNFGPVQLNLSAGTTWSGQSLLQHGKVEHDGRYLMVEGLIPVSPAHRLTAVIGAYTHRGNADIRRGYLVTGAQNYSAGSADTQTTGLRVRLEWENAYTVANTQISPYTDISYAVSRMDAYTETGGALPAQFNKRSAHSSDLRVGLNGARPILSTQFQLVGNVEIAHRLKDQADGSSGNVTGLFAFNLPDENQPRTWVKAGAGVEGMIGMGKASMMLNLTSRGEMPNAWLAASYQLTF